MSSHQFIVSILMQSLILVSLGLLQAQVGGGLLTITVINAGSRRRSRRAYRAIIGRLCNLSINIYANFKYGKITFSGDDKTIFNLARGGSGNIDVSNDIENVASQLHSQASRMSDEEYHNVPYKQKIKNPTLKGGVCCGPHADRFSGI